MSDWNPTKYAQFSDLRLRPAMDLLAAVGALPAQGGIVDLGCGAGGIGPLLADRAGGRALIGVETSQAMRAKAEEAGVYTELHDGDISTYEVGRGAALIYSNAALNWVPDHAALLPRLAEALTRSGWLAFQVPYQHDAPSHALARTVAHRLAPDAFATANADPHVLTPRSYDDLLTPYGHVRVWMTDYMQHLPAVAHGHPVRHFTQSTYLRPYVDYFEERGGGADDYLAAYDTALGAAYPLDGRGRAWFPFKRLFVTLCKA